MEEKSLKFLSTHEWAHIEGSTAICGISSHAQKELGDIVFVELPEVGTTITQSQEFGTIESTKAASQLYAPLSGKVIKVNTSLYEKPELINKDPYDGGWMIKIEISNPEEINNLLVFEKYQETIK
jgi:glycine cleavage system H protein